MEHPKIAGLSDGAFRLWVEGLAHCQKYLTDGVIIDLSCRGLRAYSPKRRALLLEAGLWDSTDQGVHVHDYLDWNDSRAHVESNRQYARERIANARARSRNVRENTDITSNEVTPTTYKHVTPITPRRPPKGADTFTAFWDVYPKKKSRSDAEKAWRKLAPSPELSQRIQDAIAAQRVSADWLKEDGKYIPYPASWLNGRRWEDALEVDAVLERPSKPDWSEECRQLHNSACGSRMNHDTRMILDRGKAS